jgi:hypothetical protein
LPDRDCFAAGLVCLKMWEQPLERMVWDVALMLEAVAVNDPINKANTLFGEDS